MEHICRILDIAPVTHDTKRFCVERPSGYTFEPGQATLISINREGSRDEKHPFSFTCLPDAEHLEFTIKGYYDHDGLTRRLHALEPGAEVILRDAFGAITYQGVGTFIAGGAGVTPFIAMLRELNRNSAIGGHLLLFSNKTARDVILEDEFRQMLDGDFRSVLTREDAPGHHHGKIDQAYLAEQINSFSQFFYVCGPESFIRDITDHLKALGASPSTIVIEE